MAFVVDLGVSMHARLSQVLAHLGFPEQARAHTEAALARAGALGQPYAQMLALFYAAVVEIRLGHPEQVRGLAERMHEMVADHAFSQGEGLWRWLHGWVLTQRGEPDDGHALIMAGYEHHVDQSMLSGAASVLGYAAEARAAAGRWSEAQAELDRALALAQRIGERIFLPELMLVQGRVALGKGEAAAARDSIRAALAEARSQQALWLELSALVALCELDGVMLDDLDALAEARARLSEGFDAELVIRADALLGANGRATRP